MKQDRSNFIPVWELHKFWVFFLIKSENLPSRMKFEMSDQIYFEVILNCVL